MSNWYLIHTKIRQERVALDHLERQGFECFLPLMRAEKLRSGPLALEQEPLFPRYLFIRLGTGLEPECWASIRSTTGVGRLVTFGQVPAKVDDALVGELRARSEASEVALRHFEPSEQVMVTLGPYMGIQAIQQTADAEGRVVMLLDILSKQVKQAMPAARIRKAS